MGLITLPNNFEKILDKTEKKKVKKVEIDDNNNNNTEDGDRIGLEVKARFFLLYRCHLGNLCWPLKNRDFELKGSPQSAPAWTVILHQINVHKLCDYNKVYILQIFCILHLHLKQIHMIFNRTYHAMDLLQEINDVVRSNLKYYNVGQIQSQQEEK